MSLVTHWDRQYAHRPIWDTGRPASELQRVVAEEGLRPCRAIELGCGTGGSAVWLAPQSFNVIGIDLSLRAIEEAQRRAQAAGVSVRFRVADLLASRTLGGPYDFFFDCGCYGAVRRHSGRADYLHTLARIVRPGALGLLLVGNARE